MRYDFEYFYIYKGNLLLSESIENMEELLELAARQKLLAEQIREKGRSYSGTSPAASSLSR